MVKDSFTPEEPPCDVDPHVDEVLSGERTRVVGCLKGAAADIRTQTGLVMRSAFWSETHGCSVVERSPKDNQIVVYCLF
ncbi:MAG: hypothetical protein CL938_04970 [Deltaproteobacteria bacterium]|jgi:hypothetical protein|nr:hypothetical protein [Deltaproteobacteria bacterium]MBT37887.1 hypothetical protein [Deltaproteobacteria bacterium]